MDPKLAKGHVRSEMRELSRKAGPDLFTAFEPYLNTIVRMGSANADQVASAAKDVESLFASDPSTIRLKRESKGRTFTRRKAQEDVRVVQVLSEGENKGMAVVCHDFRLTAYNFRCMRGLLPIEISRHACERLLERKGTDGKAVRTLAAEIVSLAGLASFFVLPGRHLPERRVALPLRGGLLMCAVEDTFHGGDPLDGRPFTAFTNDRYGETMEEEQLPAFFTDPMPMKLFILHARTWVPRSALFADQIKLFERMVEFRRRHEEACDLLETVAMFPSLSAFDDEQRFNKTLGTMRRPCDEAVDILMDPTFAGAMGNSGVPSTRPESSYNLSDRYNGEADVRAALRATRRRPPAPWELPAAAPRLTMRKPLRGLKRRA